MITHKIEDDSCPSNTMAFDQALYDHHAFDLSLLGNSPVMMDAKCTTAASPSTANAAATRLVSTPYDEQPQQDTTIDATSPCHLISSSSSSEESVTGHISNIEDVYIIDPRVLGTGHHGSVRECIHRRTGQRYAVKSICKADPSVKPAGLEREISLLQEMEHESIVRLVDVYEDDEYVHLVTDLCQGGELFDKIVEKSNTDNGAPCFTEGEAAKIMLQLLQAVSYMHKRDVVHRDIKPENILFTSSDEGSSIKLIDFGLSRKHTAPSQPPMSTIVGTPYYIAPEVLHKRYTKSCDVWSLGVIAYIMLCGYPPFNGRNSDETHRCVSRGKYYFPAEDWKDVSKDAMDFIYRLLQMDPRKRMTLQQAMNHPWIVKHTAADTSTAAATAVVPQEKVMAHSSEDEQRQDHSSVEVSYTRSQFACGYASPPPPPRKQPLSPSSRTGYSPPRRRVRASMFGL